MDRGGVTLGGRAAQQVLDAHGAEAGGVERPIDEVGHGRHRAHLQLQLEGLLDDLAHDVTTGVGHGDQQGLGARLAHGHLQRGEAAVDGEPQLTPPGEAGIIIQETDGHDASVPLAHGAAGDESACPAGAVEERASALRGLLPAGARDLRCRPDGEAGSGQDDEGDEHLSFPERQRGRTTHRFRVGKPVCAVDDDEGQRTAGDDADHDAEHVAHAGEPPGVAVQSQLDIDDDTRRHGDAEHPEVLAHELCGGQGICHDAQRQQAGSHHADGVDHEEVPRADTQGDALEQQGELAASATGTGPHEGPAPLCANLPQAPQLVTDRQYSLLFGSPATPASLTAR